MKTNKVIKITLDQHCGQQIIWLDYEDGTCKVAFINKMETYRAITGKKEGE